MSEDLALAYEGVERVSLEDFVKPSYLNYSMYVIMDRALPYIGDGLKPVQRRIVYAMSELGLRNTAKHKKSARTVGDVLGKYHPHGDSACYEAMVLMAQDFSYRYPIVDGQGNWGSSASPKEFAAMRYTEARLSPYADIFLSELPMGTVDWIPNFDGTMEEPQFMPARLPNILLNGGSGIAVGMATDIPPHNLREIVDALVHLVDNPRASAEEICEIVIGPDFPTGGEIVTPKEEIAEIYASGNGMIRIRATYEYDNGDIVITSLPYQVSSERVIEQIAGLMAAKKLPMVADVRDLSDQDDPTRIAITPRSNRVDKDALIGHLLAVTDLEKSHKVNMTFIGANRKPQSAGLMEVLGQWLEFRTETVTRRLEFRLEKINERLHVLEGLLVAYLNIDEVIRTIRRSDDPKSELMEKFDLTEIQAEAILQIRLRLARLEEIKIEREKGELEKEKEGIEKILASRRRMKTLIKKELKADAKKFGDARRTRIVRRSEARAIKEEELTPAEPVTVVLSAGGWVRAAKGHSVDPANLNYKAGDEFLSAAAGKSNQQAIFLDTSGRSYSLPAGSFPSARSQGEPLTGRLSPPEGARFLTVMMETPGRKVVLASDAGYGFVTDLSNLVAKNAKGKLALSLPKGAAPLLPATVEDVESDRLAAVTAQGRMLIVEIGELPELAKGKGNKIVQIPPKAVKKREDYVKIMAVVPRGAGIRIHAGRQAMKLTPGNVADFAGRRGLRGKKLPRGYQRVDRVEILPPETDGGGNDPA